MRRFRLPRRLDGIMPPLRLPRSLEIALAAVTAFIAAFSLLLILMTSPSVGTPVTNWALGIWGPDGASVSHAHTRFPGINTLVFRDFEAREKAAVTQGTVRANFFGFLPGIAWVSRAEAEGGFVAVNRDGPRTEGGFSIGKWRRVIDDVAIREIEVRVTRNQQTNTILLEQALGSLRSGSLVVNASGGGSTLAFDGNADASSLSQLTGELRITGQNFADFALLAGFAAPDTPPYDAVAGLTIAGNLWTFGFRPETRIGDSDISGPVTLQFGRETPLIDARLRSANLDFDDLGIVFGVPIGVGQGETVNDEQVKARETLDQSDRLIPNAVVDFSRLDAIDGTVSLEAEEGSDAIFAIRSLKLDVEIEGRVVRAPLVELQFARGKLNTYVTLDGSQSPAMTTAEGKLTGVPFDNLAADPYLRGDLNGEFKLEGRGDGFRDAAASLAGRLSLWSENADLLQIAAEAAALDVGELILLLNDRAGREKYTPGRCTAINLDFADGIGTFDPGVIDTDDSLVLIDGQVNLKQEALDLTIRSEAKDVSFGTLFGNISVGGTFRDPEVSAIGPEILLQFGIATLLGSITGGLAALPFVETGGAPDAPCADLLARARSVRP